MNKVFFFILGGVILGVLSIAAISLAEKQIPQSLMGGSEQESPNDWIKEEQIKVFNNQVMISIQNPTWASFTNTNSMDPFIDETSHAIQISPQTAEMIKVGDVISYQTVYGIIIHRVVDINHDEKGIYFRVKGDNNVYPDPQKVRFSDIQGVVVAVIY